MKRLWFVMPVVMAVLLGLLGISCTVSDTQNNTEPSAPMVHADSYFLKTAEADFFVADGDLRWLKSGKGIGIDFLSTGDLSPRVMDV